MNTMIELWKSLKKPVKLFLIGVGIIILVMIANNIF